MVSSVSAAEPGKTRLFILSGQSNMAGLNPDVSFTPTLKKAYPDDELVVVKSAQHFYASYGSWRGGSSTSRRRVR